MVCVSTWPNPQGVLYVFPIREFSTKRAEHFDFLSIKPQPFAFILPCLLVLACFFGQSRCFRSFVNFFMIWWLLSSHFPPKKEYSEPCTCFHFDILAHVLFHQRKIHSDFRNQKLPSPIPQCILCHLKPRLSFCKRMPRAFCLLFLKRLPLAILCLFQGFSTFWYDTKNNKKEHVHYVFLREW